MSIILILAPLFEPRRYQVSTLKDPLHLPRSIKFELGGQRLFNASEKDAAKSCETRWDVIFLLKYKIHPMEIPLPHPLDNRM